MTKTLKKGLIAILMAVLALTSCLAVANVSLAFAETTSLTANELAFVESVNDLGADTDYATKLANDLTYYVKVKTMYGAYQNIGTEAQAVFAAAQHKTGATQAEQDEETRYVAYTKFNAVYSVFKPALEFDSNVNKVISNAVPLRFSSFDAYVEIVDLYRALKEDPDTNSWLINATGDVNFLDTQWAEFENQYMFMLTLKDKIDAIRTQVNGLVYDGANLNWSERAAVGYPAAARASAPLATPDVETLYKNATGTASLIAKIKDYGKLAIASNATYDDVMTELRKIITDVKTDKFYEGVDAVSATTILAADKYTAQDFVTKFNTAVNECEKQDDRITTFYNRIDALDATAPVNNAIANAVHKEVEDLANALVNYGIGKDLYYEGEVNAVKNLKVNDSNLRKSNLKCDATITGVLGLYRSALSPIIAAAQVVINAIDAIGEVDLTKIDAIKDADDKLAAFKATEFTDVNGAPVYGIYLLGFITNTNVLAAADTERDRQIEKATTWMTDVLAIKDKISVADFEAIDKLGTDYAALDTIIKDKIEADTGVTKLLVGGSKVSLKAAYDRYQDLVSYESDLKADIAAVAELMENGDLANDKLDTDNYPTDITGKTKFHKLLEGSTTPLYKGATVEYKKIADDKEATNYKYAGAQEYLQTNYPLDYANYLKALDLDSVFAFEEAVAVFGDKTTAKVNPSEITIDDYSDIKDARKIYKDSIQGDAKKVARVNEDKYNGSTKSYYEVLELAEADMLAITNRIDAYIELVVAVSTNDAIGTQIAIDMVKLAVADEYYNADPENLSAAEKADTVYVNDTYGLSCKTAKDLYDTIVTRHDTLKSDFENRADEFIAKSSDYMYNQAWVAEYNLLVARYNAFDTTSRAAAAPLTAVTSQQGEVTSKYNALVNAGKYRILDVKAEVEDKLAAINTAIESLKADIATNKADIATNKADIATNKADIAGIKTDISAIKSDIASLEATVATLATNTALTSAVAELNSTIAAVKTELEGEIASAVSALEAKITAEETARKAADEALKADLEAEKAARVALENEVKELIAQNAEKDKLANILIGVIGGVLIAVALAGVIILFVKKRD